MSKLSNGFADPEKALAMYREHKKGWTPRTDALLQEAPSNWSLTYASSLIKLCRDLEYELGMCAGSCELFKKALQQALSIRDDLRDRLQKRIEQCPRCVGFGDWQMCLACRTDSRYLKSIA